MKWMFSIGFALLFPALYGQLDMRNESVVDVSIQLDQGEEMILPEAQTPEIPPRHIISKMAAPDLQIQRMKEPLFCRLEDQISNSTKVQFKFRLGSVQYVDALEGKAYFEAVGYSRATDFLMSRAAQ